MASSERPEDDWRPETLAVATGRPHGPGAPLNTPPYLASTFMDGGNSLYGRYGNPSYTAFEQALGALEGGHAVCFSTGMAAVAAVVEDLPVGARVVLGQDIYQGTRSLLADLAAKERAYPDPVDLRDLAAVSAKLAGAALLWVESPSNPLVEVVDLEVLAGLAADAGVPMVVDSTFATPFLQNPLRLGAWAVVHSATKYIGGHSDLMMGAVVVATDEHADALAKRRILHGAAPGAMDAFLALRGLRTLGVRVAASVRSAGVLADRLDTDARVAHVYYPGLPGDPGHETATKQMRGYGGMLSFCVASEHDAERLLSRLRLVAVATSLGGVESLAERRNRWPTEGAPTGLIRLSVGLEHVEDLWADLDHALG